jgi:hypothetical protein
LQGNKNEELILKNEPRHYLRIKLESFAQVSKPGISIEEVSKSYLTPSGSEAMLGLGCINFLGVADSWDETFSRI